MKLGNKKPLVYYVKMNNEVNKNYINIFLVAPNRGTTLEILVSVRKSVSQWIIS